MTNTRRRLTGEVTKAKMEKTVTVRVDRSYRHPLYGKVIRSSKNYLVHDLMSCRPGDLVSIVESKPISKKKRWVVEKILDRPSDVEVTASAVEAEIEAEMVEEPETEVEAEMVEEPETEVEAELAEEGEA
jgi:small subunit ribosomal protein S17